MRKALVVAALLLSAPLTLAGPALAAKCGNNAAGFPAWLASFKREAVASGISSRTVEAALGGMTYNTKVIRLDRNQKSFKLSFEQFLARRAPPSTIAIGKRRMKQHEVVLDRVERKYGVPKEVIVSIWGLESGFGGFMGDIPIFSSLSALAYDCRRSAFFTNELMSALRIADRGQMRISEMKGAWAGEIGQTQFLASSYERFAVDFDGDGRPNLIRSPADVFASTANFLRQHGWQKGGDWSPGSSNYAVLRDWNRAEVYRRTIAHFATELTK
ncbi:lytic murein transglycosylase [Stappia indica]|uniref:Lytic murein transglycosylase n=1 Tax=Stappia indica TaxID=538381 RepID=A0A285S2F9_9HYPH|nr:lytic murein transglycosylase [Stappia indica]SOC00997.1 lytic murein transglycosylase [Stappia indica]